MFNVRLCRLECEYATDPLGVDVANPRLSWQLQVSSRRRGVVQSAYQVLVASSRELLVSDIGDLWDSGKVFSDKSVYVLYDGKELISSQKVFWKARVWDEYGSVTPWSNKASWTMGILSDLDWNTSWIAAPNYKKNKETILLRKEFWVNAGLHRAVVHVCGLGHFEMSLNGNKIGDNLFSPGWTKYDKTCLYETHDITSVLREGQNAIGLFLANGMYNVARKPYYVPGWTRYSKFGGSYGPLKAIAQLRFEYEDGTTQIIGTDESWLVKAGPITFSCMFGGEDYDSRLESQGWNEPGYNDASWKTAIEVNGPGGKLRGHCSSAPPIRTFETLKPKKVTKLNEKVTMYDLGQNVSLIPKIKVVGPRGSKIRIMPSELLGEDGFVDRRSCTHGGGSAYWQYTLSGNGEEFWFPKFFYHGSRYLQVECYPPKGSRELPSLVSIEAVVMHSSSRRVGSFVCSNDLFNRIYKLISWAQRSNLMHVITDCPHRERMGWLEQYHLHGPSLRYEFDLAQMYAKGMIDMADSQLDNGLIPDTAPEYALFGGGFRDSPEWGSAYVLVPWQQYEWTGNIELLRRHYDGMKRYVAYLTSRSENHIVSHGLGDWFDIGPNAPGIAQLTPIALTATAFYYLDAVILSSSAELLGFADEAEQFNKLSSEIRAAFNRTFFNKEKGQYATGSQCANSIPLVMGLVEPQYREELVEAIVQDVRDRGNAITAGDIGYRYLLLALAQGGRSDVIFDMNNQSDKPGYGYQLKQGATSLTEGWAADKDRSWNHFMLGQIMEWFYHDLAGIGLDPERPGFKKIIIKPNIVGDITRVSASYESPYGTVSSAWFLTNDVLHMHVTMPPNTSATVFVPSSPGEVTENDDVSDENESIRYIGYENGCSIYEIGSGFYHFEAILNN